MRYFLMVLAALITILTGTGALTLLFLRGNPLTTISMFIFAGAWAFIFKVCWDGDDYGLKSSSH